MNVAPNPSDEDAIRIRYRIRFGKVDLLKWISHRDLASLWERMIRRAFLKPSMTEGFHPKPRISFASALALGVESDDEVVDIDFAEEISPADLMSRLVADRQPGLILKSVAKLPASFGKAKLSHLDYEIAPPSDASAGVDLVQDPASQGPEKGSFAISTTNPHPTIGDGIAHVLATDTITLKRKKKDVTIHLKEQVRSLSFDGELIRLSLSHSDGATLRPEDVLDLIGLSDFRENGGRIRRTAVVLANEFLSDDPELMVISDSSIATPEPSPEQPLGVH